MLNYKVIILFISLSFFSSCIAIDVVKTLFEPEPLTLKDYSPKHEWVGTLNKNSYVLSFDSLDGIWFRGNLSINKNQKIRFVGFEKGYTLVTHLQPAVHLIQRLNFDTIRVNPNYGLNQYFPHDLILLKKRK